MSADPWGSKNVTTFFDTVYFWLDCAVNFNDCSWSKVIIWDRQHTDSIFKLASCSWVCCKQCESKFFTRQSFWLRNTLNQPLLSKWVNGAQLDWCWHLDNGYYGSCKQSFARWLSCYSVATHNWQHCYFHLCVGYHCGYVAYQKVYFFFYQEVY